VSIARLYATEGLSEIFSRMLLQVDGSLRWSEANLGRLREAIPSAWLWQWDTCMCCVVNVWWQFVSNSCEPNGQ